MPQQTFTLDDEMSLMIEMCVKLNIVHQIVIFKDDSARPYEKSLQISDPSRDPHWIRIGSLVDLVAVVAERKLGDLAQKYGCEHGFDKISCAKCNAAPGT